MPTKSSEIIKNIKYSLPSNTRSIILLKLGNYTHLTRGKYLSVTQLKCAKWIPNKSQKPACVILVR